MNKLLEQAKALRKAAAKLEEEAEALELPRLQEKYNDLVGTCWMVKESSGNDKWTEYWYVKEIENLYITSGGQDNVSLRCMYFCIDKPSWGIIFIGNEQRYLSTFESYAKKISREVFNKKFVELQEKMLI